MKGFLPAMTVALSMLFASWGSAAQEMSFRKGVVTGITPVQVQAQASSSSSGRSATGGALGRVFGRALGRAVSKAAGQYSPEAYEVGSSLAQDAAASTRSGGGKQVTACLVMVRFDNGSESAIQAASVDNLRIGGRINVLGSGSSTQVVAAL